MSVGLQSWSDVATVEMQAPDEVLVGKTQWRAWARRRRRSYSAQERAAHAAAVAEHLHQLADHLGARMIGLYAAIGAELDTRPLANRLLASGFELAYPRMAPQSAEIEYVACAGPAALQPRPKSRLMEPVGPAIEATDLDLLVTPALAVNGQLIRLGQGGGSYDRYLPRVMGQVCTVAVAASALCVPWGPADAHDRAVDLVCTERGLAKACS